MSALWGLTTLFQGFVTSYDGLIACRFFIGLFEGTEEAQKSKIVHVV